MKKPSLLKTRYAENPFINGDSFSVPLKKKAEVIQTEGPAAVTVGDERIAIAQIRRITTVDSDPFEALSSLNWIASLTCPRPRCGS